MKNKKNWCYQNGLKQNEFTDFERGCYSRTATGIYKVGHDTYRIMKW